MKIMIITESVIWTRRLYRKVLSFLYGITTLLLLVIQHGRTRSHCKLSIGVRTSLVHVLKCEGALGHRLHQELWRSHCSFACGIYFSTVLGPSFCDLVGNQQEWVLYSLLGMQIVWIHLFRRKTSYFEAELQMVVWQGKYKSPCWA